MMQKIGVFLSARTNIDAVYKTAADEVGEWIGKTGRTLVYGGSRAGLMEVIAAATKRNGGKVYGVVPQIITQRHLESELIDVCFPCADLTDRKSIMMQESDVLLALPGGIGTLDELFTVLGVSAIGIQGQRPLVLYNVAGCWDKLIALLEDLCQKGFITRTFDEVVSVATNVEELERVITKLEDSWQAVIGCKL